MWMTRLIVALLAALCVLPAYAQQAKPADKAAEKPSTAELLKTADATVKETASLRSLSVRTPVKRGVLGREAIREKLKVQIARQYTPEEIRIEAKVLKGLGLLPPDLDYEKLQLDLLMEQVGGFYDPWGKQLYIADWLPLGMQPAALSHEIVHALQDQHFDLKKFVEAVHDQGDRQLARGALVEGDATGVMLEFQGKSDLSTMPDMARIMEVAMASGALMGAAGSMPVMEKAPDFVKQSMMFPYVGGLGFIQYIRKRYPWSKVDECYKHPPESTEQIIHPEKYFNKEHPIWIKAAPIAALKPAKMVHEDTVGELQIRLWLKEVAHARNAAEAAAGWGGDRLAAYQTAPDAPYEIVWLTQWDTDNDAAEFAAAAKPGVDKMKGWSSGAKGNQVLLMFQVPEAERDKVAADVLKSWKPSKTAPQ